jgi:uncharacterized protein
MSDPTQSGQQTPGWYPDPQSGQLRWWDGQQWGQFAEGGQAQAGQAPVPTGGSGVQNPTQMAMLAHALGIITGFLGPLIIWLTAGKQDPYVEDQSIEALNWQLTMLIAYIVSAVLFIVLIGILLYFIVFIAVVAYGIIAAMAANRGEWYRYPFSIKFVKPTMGGAPA